MALGLEAGDLEAEALGRRPSPSCSWPTASSTAAWISSRLGWLDEPPAAKWAPIRSPSRVTAVRSGRSAMSARAAGRSSTTATLKSRRATAARISAGASTTSRAYVAVAGQRGPGGVVGRPATEQQAGAAEVVALEVGDRLDGGVGTGDDDRVGGGAEGGRDGRLVARLHAQQRGHRAHQARHGVGGGEQRTGAVLAVEPELERVATGHQPGAGRDRPAGPPRGPWPGARRCRRGPRRRPRAPRRGPPRRRRARRPGSRATVKSFWARSARASASSRAEWRRPISSAAAAARDFSALTWPCSRASPSRRSAAARTSPAMRRSSSAAASSAVRRRPTAASRAVAVLLDLSARSRPPARAPARPGPRARRGRARSRRCRRRPHRRRCGAARPPATGCRAGVPSARRGRTTSPGPWPAPGGRCAARPRAPLSCSRACASAASTSARRSTRIVSSAISCSSACRALTRSSATSRARASRTSACTDAARRATSA